MADTGLEQTGPVDTGAGQAGELRLGENPAPDVVALPVPTAELEAKIATPQRPSTRTGTIEHLAARRLVTPLNAEAPEVKKHLSEIRPEITTLVTNLRWGGALVQDTAQQLIPLLNVGPISQWAPVLIPFLLEIDRAGNLVPVWLNIIESEDPLDLPPDANPADTPLGRAKRYAMLMLGNYKTPELSQKLGEFATDPDKSLYATQALVKQATTAAMQALIIALKDAAGWAKVDVVEACLTLQQVRFHELLLASGFDRVAGLESYIAVPIFRSLSLERYLRGEKGVAPRLSQQASLIFAQVTQDSMKPVPAGASDSLPIVFERPLAPLATALFEGARTTPNWQNVLAVHRLAMLLGRYWSEIARGVVQDPGIVEPVYATVPLMPEVERWMNGPGRDVLLAVLNSGDEEAIVPVVKVLGELREPRAIGALLSMIEGTKGTSTREQALRLSHICDTLGRLGDRRVVQPLLQLAERCANLAVRAARSKRRDNLPVGDADIPSSIVLAAVIRAIGQLNATDALDFVIGTTNDFDPYVRAEALETLKRIDPTPNDGRSSAAAREALNDPRDSIVHIASQLVAQYRDSTAVPTLQRITQARPALASAAYDALRQLGQ